MDFLGEYLEIEPVQETDDAEIPRVGYLTEDEEEEELQFDLELLEPPPLVREGRPSRRRSREWDLDDFDDETRPPSPIVTIVNDGPSIANILLEAELVAMMYGLDRPGSRSNPIDLAQYF